MDDADLVRGALAGRRADFDALVERHQRALYAFALRFLRDHEQAADIVQTSFLQAYSHLRQFSGRSSFKTWLHQIALNQCRALYRSGRDRQTVPLEEVAATLEATGTDSEPAARTARADLQRLIARLPLRQRAVMTLRVFSDLPFSEIARIEGISENSAKVSYHHAIVRLRQWLGEETT